MPRPANLQLQGMTITREAHGPGGASAVTTLQVGGSMWVNPVTRAPSHGGLTADTAAWLTSPGHLTLPYTYSINRVDPAGLILRDQRYVVRPGDLATVQENYDQDVRTSGGPSCTAAAATFPVGVCVGQDVACPAAHRRPHRQPAAAG